MARWIWGDPDLGSMACKNGFLRQGHPLAPLIANVASRELKKAWQHIVGAHGGVIVTYADDCCIVVPRGVRLRQLIGKIVAAAESQGFKIAKDKTKVVKNRDCVNLLGMRLIGRSEVTVRRNVRRRKRALAHALIKAAQGAKAPDSLVNQFEGLDQWERQTEVVKGSVKYRPGEYLIVEPIDPGPSRLASQGEFLLWHKLYSLGFCYHSRP